MRNNDYVFACVLSLMPRFFQVCYPAPHPGTHTACEAGGPPPIHLQGAINPGQLVHLLRDPLAVARKIQSRQETISNKTQAMARRSKHFQAASPVKRRSTRQFLGNIGYKKTMPGWSPLHLALPIQPATPVARFRCERRMPYTK